MKKNLRSICAILLFSSVAVSSTAQLVKSWDYRFGGTSFDELHTIEQTNDGGYILGGYTNSPADGDITQPSQGTLDYWIVKTDAAGIMQWNRRYGGSDADQFTTLHQTPDGGYIIGGFSSSPVSGDKSQPVWGNYGYKDYWVIKIDSVGTKQWDKTFGGVDDDKLYSIDQASDGGYILGGFSNSGISGDRTQNCWGAYDYWIVKIDSLGTKEWDKRFGGTETEALFGVRQTPGGGYILSGCSKSGISGDKTQPSWGDFDFWLVKIDSAGDLLWDVRYGGTDIDQLLSMDITSDGGFILGGTTTSGVGGDKTEPNKGGYDYYIIKTDSLGIKQWDKDFGGDNDEDDFEKVSQTLDGGYLLSGTSYSDVSGDKTENNLGVEQPWIVKTDASGIQQWDKTIFLNDHTEQGFAIQTSDGCYTMGTSTGADIGGYKTQSSWDIWFNSNDYWIVKFCDTTFINSSVPNFISNDTDICEKFCINFFDSSANNPVAWQWIFPGGAPASSTDQNPANICYDVPGVYDVTLITTTANGTDTLTLHDYITVYPTPPFPTITQAGYTLTSSTADSYQWQFNAADISGATNQSYTVMQTGYYTVMVGDSNGCVNSATVYVLISGMDEVNDTAISIYPNPSNGNFMVVLNDEIADEVSINVVNTLGQEVFSSDQSRSIGITSTSHKKEIDLMHLPDGVYYITVLRRSPFGQSENIFLMKQIMIAR